VGVPSPASPRSRGVPKGDTRAAPPASQFTQLGAYWFRVRGAGGKRQVSTAFRERSCKPGIKSPPAPIPSRWGKARLGVSRQRPCPSPGATPGPRPPPSCPQQRDAGVEHRISPPGKLLSSPPCSPKTSRKNGVRSLRIQSAFINVYGSAFVHRESGKGRSEEAAVLGGGSHQPGFGGFYFFPFQKNSKEKTRRKPAWFGSTLYKRTLCTLSFFPPTPLFI